MDDFMKERIEKEDALKNTYPIGLVVVTKDMQGHHRLFDNLIGIVARVERNDYVRELGVTICFANNYYEEFYQEELEKNFIRTDQIINSTATHALSTDSQIEEYVSSPSFANAIQLAHERISVNK